MNDIDLVVEVGGKLKFIYNDELHELLSFGESKITRVSYVEPFGLCWMADMAPVGGPILGPFDLRQEALDAEVAYIKKHVLEGE